MGLLILLPTHEAYGHTNRYAALGDRQQKSTIIPAKDSASLSYSDAALNKGPEHDDVSKQWSSPPVDHSLLPDIPTDGKEKTLHPAELRAYMLTHSIEGYKFMRERSPFVGEVITFPSPIDPEVNFGIRRLGNREVMAYRDKNSVVRFISEEESGRYIQEKDYPAGTMRIDTILLGLASWNIVNPQNQAVIPIDKESILSYLDPKEFDAIYEKVHELNPILLGREEQKND